MGERDIDQALVERVQKGDKKAFDILVLKYQQRVMNILSRYVRDPSEVQDLAQETFIKAYRALASFRGDSAFYTWVYRIAINTAKNFIVAQKRRPPKDDVEASEAEQFSGSEGLHEHASPERILLKDEIADIVFNAIDELPEDLKMAITLREIEGLSYEEIAETMSCPIGTVRSRIFRAREAIDEKLNPLINE